MSSGCAKGENPGPPIDAGVREPALRARDDARRRIDAARSRVLPDDEASLGVPRQRLHALALVREIQERRQQRPGLDLTLRDELRNANDLAVATRRPRVDANGERAVCGAEIDPDGEARSREAPPPPAPGCARHIRQPAAAARAGWLATRGA